MKKTFSFYIILTSMTFVSFIFAYAVTNQDSFWMEAAQSGMTEVMLGNLALQKSQNEEVKKLAQMIVDDHAKVNEDFKALAERKNVTLPADMNTKQKATMGKLNELSDSDFDKEFVKTMVKDHETTVKLFQKQADIGTDPDLKMFAINTLPTLKSHLKVAETMNDNINKKIN